MRLLSILILLLLLLLLLTAGRLLAFKKDLFEWTHFGEEHVAFGPTDTSVRSEILGPEVIHKQFVRFGFERLENSEESIPVVIIQRELTESLTKIASVFIQSLASIRRSGASDAGGSASSRRLSTRSW